MRKRVIADGLGYALVAGPAWRTRRDPDHGLEPFAEPPLDLLLVAAHALAGLYRLAYWRRRGIVVLTRGRRRWVWLTLDGRTAESAAATLAHLVESGAWRPGSGPPPDLPGATRSA